MSESSLTLAMDLGASYTKIGVVQDANSLVGDPVVVKTSDGFTAVETFRGAVTDALRDRCDLRLENVARTNVAIHGTVEGNRLTRASGGLRGLKNADFADLLGPSFGRLVNDAHAAAFGAIRAFGSNPHRPTCVLTLGTNVGFAIVRKGDTVELDETVPSQYRRVFGNNNRNAHYLLGGNGYRRAGSKATYTDILRDFLLHIAEVRQAKSFVVFGGLSAHVAKDRLGDLTVFLDPEKQYEHILVGLSRA